MNEYTTNNENKPTAKGFAFFVVGLFSQQA